MKPNHKGKIVIISAPSGCGKSTIISAINERGNVSMKFSVSATNRPPRPGEINGIHYHFLSDKEFHENIERNNFVEYEEVYPGRFYGTLKSEIDDRMAAGDTVVLDIDVKGGVNVKNMYPDNSLALFIEPPSIEALKERLTGRGTESADSLSQRLARAEYEISFAPSFDCIIVNDSLDKAVEEVETLISDFIGHQ